MGKSYLKRLLVGGGIVALFGLLSAIEGTKNLITCTVGFLWKHQSPLLISVICFLVGPVCLFPWIKSLYKNICELRTSTHASVLNRGQFLERFQCILSDAQNKVVVVGLDKEWVFPLVVTLALARSRNIDIQVVFRGHAHQRYRLLTYLGCEVFYLDGPSEIAPFKGVLVDPDSILYCRALALVPRHEGMYARYYHGSLDFPMISTAFEHAQMLMSNASYYGKQYTDFIPSFKSISQESLIEALKKVPLYKNTDISFEPVVIKKTIPVSSYVNPYKLNQAKKLLDLFDENHWEYFTPCAITLANNRNSIVIPPILEEHEKKLYLAEGHSRLYELRCRGKINANVVVVKKINVDLPKKPSSWQKVMITDEKVEKRNPELARYIETGTHRDVWGVNDEEK